MEWVGLFVSGAVPVPGWRVGTGPGQTLTGRAESVTPSLPCVSPYLLFLFLFDKEGGGRDYGPRGLTKTPCLFSPKYGLRKRWIEMNPPCGCHTQPQEDLESHLSRDPILRRTTWDSGPHVAVQRVLGPPS